MTQELAQREVTMDILRNNILTFAKLYFKDYIAGCEDWRQCDPVDETGDWSIYLWAVSIELENNPVDLQGLYESWIDEDNIFLLAFHCDDFGKYEECVGPGFCLELCYGNSLQCRVCCHANSKVLHGNPPSWDDLDLTLDEDITGFYEALKKLDLLEFLNYEIEKAILG